MSFSTPFAAVRYIMKQELLKDPELLHGYEANVAMLLRDRYNRVNFQDPEWRNSAAKDIMALIFGFNEKTSKSLRYYADLTENDEEHEI